MRKRICISSEENLPYSQAIENASDDERGFVCAGNRTDDVMGQKSKEFTASGVSLDQAKTHDSMGTGSYRLRKHFKPSHGRVFKRGLNSRGVDFDEERDLAVR